MRFARLHPKISVIALASRYGSTADVNRFVKQYFAGSRVRLVRDPKGSVARAYGIEYHPRFVALDAKGRKIGSGYSLSDALGQARYDRA